MTTLEVLTLNEWHTPVPKAENITIPALESGKILFFPELSFTLFPTEHRFLSPHFVAPKTKNISYNPNTYTLKGAQGSRQELAEIQYLLTRFSQYATTLVINTLPLYQHAIKMGRTSFRPVQVSHRKISYRKDDKRLHVDAFPANPNQGLRILRVFSNINLHGENRVWRVGEKFETVAKRFLPKISPQLPGSAKLLHLLSLTRTHRTHYDHIMLQIHNRMKKDLHYQVTTEQTELQLPPNTTWIVQTDHVSHAAMSGQHLLEQTFYLPVDAMQDPEQSPLRILERLMKKRLV